MTFFEYFFTAADKEDRNQRACKSLEPEIFLQWGNKKRLRCVRVKDPQISQKSNGVVRRKISSRFLVKESSLLQTTRLTRWENPRFCSSYKKRRGKGKKNFLMVSGFCCFWLVRDERPSSKLSLSFLLREALFGRERFTKKEGSFLGFCFILIVWETFIFLFLFRLFHPKEKHQKFLLIQTECQLLRRKWEQNLQSLVKLEIYSWWGLVAGIPRQPHSGQVDMRTGNRRRRRRRTGTTRQEGQR